MPNKDVLVVESIREWPGREDRPEKSANRITFFRDADNDGKPDLRETFLTGFNMPEGMLLLGNWFYVGNTDNVMRYPYRAGQTKIDGKGEKILDLPAGGHHTRTLSADPAGKKIYVAIGSASNVDEENAWEKDQARRYYRNQSRRQRHADLCQGAAQSRRHGLGAANQNSLDRRQ